MSNEVQKTASEEKTPARAWLILAVTYIISFMAPLTQFKVPPLASWLIPDFGMDAVSFGYLMSALSIIGLILAFPASWICRKAGLKATVLISAGALVVGNALFAVANSYAMLAFARLVEGIGMGLIGVAGPSCVSVWFPDKTRPIALGLWATWAPVGITLSFNTIPTIAGSMGWRTVMWIITVISIVAFLLFLFIFKLPEGKTEEELDNTSVADSFKLLKNPQIWILGLCFFCFNYTMLGVINSFYNTYLEGLGYAAQAASSLTSIFTVLSIPGVPLVGVIMSRVSLRGSKYWLAFGGYFAFILAMLVGFHAEIPGMLPLFIILTAIAGSFPAGIARPMAPKILGASASGAAMSMGVLQFCQNLGATLGSPIFGWGIENLGWVGAANALVIPVLVIGFIASFFVITKKNDPSKKLEEDK